MTQNTAPTTHDSADTSCRVGRDASRLTREDSRPGQKRLPTRSRRFPSPSRSHFDSLFASKTRWRKESAAFARTDLAEPLPPPKYKLITPFFSLISPAHWSSQSSSTLSLSISLTRSMSSGMTKAFMTFPFLGNLEDSAALDALEGLAAFDVLRFLGPFGVGGFGRIIPPA